MHDKPMRQMTLSEYLRHSLMQHIAKDAEEEGIEIVDVKSRGPKLATRDGEVVELRPAPQGEG
jgi:hypothetical protein